MYTQARVRSCLAAYAERQRHRADLGELAPETAANTARKCHLLASAAAGLNPIADARAFVAARLDAGIAPSTVRASLIQFIAALHWAGPEWLGCPPPTRREIMRLLPRGTAPARPRRRLSTAELRALLEAAHPAWRGLWALLVGTGLRVSEALSLRWRDIDERMGTIRVLGKGTCLRVAVLPPESARWLPRPGAPGDFLFPGRAHGSHASRNGAAAALARDLHAAGIDPTGISPHAFRHTAQSRWIEAGATIPEFKALGGWRTTSIPIEIYSHADPDRIRALAARAFPGSTSA